MIPPLASKPVQPGPDRKLQQAAQDIEALFVRQMLAAARKVSLADDDDVLGSSAGRSFAEMRDASFAEIAARSESFGLARMFADRLGQKEG